jgi:hypothetical protein
VRGDFAFSSIRNSKTWRAQHRLPVVKPCAVCLLLWAQLEPSSAVAFLP